MYVFKHYDTFVFINVLQEFVLAICFHHNFLTYYWYVHKEVFKTTFNYSFKL